MKWINIKTQKPNKTLYSPCVMLNISDEQILVFGYDAINYMAQYKIAFRDVIAEINPGIDGNYIFDGLIISKWTEIEKTGCYD